MILFGSVLRPTNIVEMNSRADWASLLGPVIKCNIKLQSQSLTRLK